MRGTGWAMVVMFPLMGSPLLAQAQGTAQAQVQSVGITQLPPAVQDTFQAEIGNGRVQNLRRETTSGGERYAGQVITGGQSSDIAVDANGVVVQRSQPRDETPAERAQDR
jgi:hypothetical protein